MIIKKVKVILLLAAVIFSSLSVLSCSQGPVNEAETTETDNNNDVIVSAGKTFYVSAEGNDSNDGSKDNPLATLNGARDAVRRFRAENGLPEGGIEVVFAPGNYRIDSQSVFTSEDSGESGKPVVYRSENGKEVIFDGGITIDPSLFVPASEEIKSKLTDEDVREKLLQVDLKSAGCYDLDDSREYEIGWQCIAYRQELYVDNERQTVARWPNAEYVWDTIYYQDTEYPIVNIPQEKADLWASEPDIRYFGYPVYDWDAVSMGSGAVRIDRENSVYEMLKTGHYQIKGVESCRYYLYNMLCELDEPGEYYWDVDASMLYYYPETDLKECKISFSQFADDFIVFDGASDISFCGFTIENFRACAFKGDTGSTGNINIDSCIFRDIGGYAVLINGYRSNVLNCEIYNMGAGCIKLTGGISNDVLANGSLISNNYIHDWSQTYTVYNPAVSLNGYGFTVSHNEICNSPHEAIAFNCGGSVIENNYIHGVCRETGDAGAVYSGRRWDWSANIIRYNRIDSTGTTATQRPCGIYLDDCLSGQIVYGNLVVDTDGLWIGGGKKNYVWNNIFVLSEGFIGVTYDERGAGNDFMHSTIVYPDGYMWKMITSNIDYLSDMQRFAVPENLLLIELSGYSEEIRPDDPGLPTYAHVFNNIAYVKDGGLVIGRNDMPSRLGTYESNIDYVSDPGFRDPQNGDYSLKDDSRVFRDIPGFENIDLDDIGLLNKER